MNSNTIRWSIIQALKRKNLSLATLINEYLHTLTDDKKIAYMMKLSRKLIECSSLSIYTEKPTGIEGITNYMCGEKLCFICNERRARVTRWKYYNWFLENMTLRRISINGVQKVVTASKYNKSFSSFPFKKIDYEVMRFSLTVPYNEEQMYRAKTVYFDELTSNLAALRRLKFWKENILGGEYGVKMERNWNGVYINICGIILVCSVKNIRNILHRELLLNWNRISIDPNHSRRSLNETERRHIMNDNELLTGTDIDTLDSRGAIYIKLETICKQCSKTRTRSHKESFTEDKFLKSLLEAIKYHFEPPFFNNDDKSFDLEMVANIRPLIAGRAMFKKFGCMVGELCLNSSQESQTENDGTDTGIDREARGKNEQKFYIVNPALMYNEKDRLIWSPTALEKRIEIQSVSIPQAVDYLSSIIKQSGRNSRPS